MVGGARLVPNVRPRRISSVIVLVRPLQDVHVFDPVIRMRRLAASRIHLDQNRGISRLTIRVKEMNRNSRPGRFFPFGVVPRGFCHLFTPAHARAHARNRRFLQVTLLF